MVDYISFILHLLLLTVQQKHDQTTRNTSRVVCICFGYCLTAWSEQLWWRLRLFCWIFSTWINRNLCVNLYGLPLLEVVLLQNFFFVFIDANPLASPSVKWVCMQGIISRTDWSTEKGMKRWIDTDSDSQTTELRFREYIYPRILAFTDKYVQKFLQYKNEVQLEVGRLLSVDIFISRNMVN